MSREYTAQEMRLVADNVCSDFTFARVNVGSDARHVYREIKPHEVADMLRQAADMIEREEGREKKYEYATQWPDGYTCSPSDDMLVQKEFIRITGDGLNLKLVRRSVGDWEEVQDEAS